MINAVIFDLDGTLVNTEPLKLLAHARAALELSPGGLQAGQVISAATRFIGVPSPETAVGLLERLGLEERARARMAELGVTAPWQVYSRLHLAAVRRLLTEPHLRAAQFPHAVSLLREVRRAGFRTGLATMSSRGETQRILSILDWVGLFDVVLTAGEVQHGKPDPEIYLSIARTLTIAPARCLVIEDSPSGVTGALAAGMPCIAVPTDLTRAAVHRTSLDQHWIVDDPGQLRSVVERVLNLDAR